MALGVPVLGEFLKADALWMIFVQSNGGAEDWEEGLLHAQLSVAAAVANESFATIALFMMMRTRCIH
jgi:hypothetical protein